MRVTGREALNSRRRDREKYDGEWDFATEDEVFGPERATATRVPGDTEQGVGVREVAAQPDTFRF